MSGWSCWAAALPLALALGACGDVATDPSAAVSGVAAIALGVSHACALGGDGRAYCWGSNTEGQLGVGAPDTTRRLTPVPVATSLRFTRITAGASHSCALAADGGAYCWGGRVPLGDGVSSSSAAPLRVSSAASFTEIIAGDAGTCALTAAGAAWCWGLNTHGELGTGVFGEGGKGGPPPDSAIVKVPRPVLGAPAFASLSVLARHACGLTAAGAAWCWGDAGQGRLGNGAAPAPSAAYGFGVPGAVAGGAAFTRIAVGGAHSCALAADGSAWCWGESAEGQTGLGARSPNPTAPARVAGGWRFAALALGIAHSCALTADGAAYCWGSNLVGALGIGGEAARADVPTAVAGGLHFRTLSARAYATCGVALDGAAYCWGQNVTGTVGDGTTTNRSAPTRVRLTL